MRGFYITGILFLILIVCGVANYIYIGSIYDHMTAIIDKISDVPSEENVQMIEELQKYWESKNTLASVSISYIIIDEVSNMIDSLSAYNQTQNVSEFANAKKLLRNSVDDIKRLEQFSVKNIF